MPSASSSSSESSGDEETQKQRRQRFAEAVDPNFAVDFGRVEPKNSKTNSIPSSSGGSKIPSIRRQIEKEENLEDEQPSFSGFQKFVASKLDEILDRQIEFTQTAADFSSCCDQNHEDSPPLFHTKRIKNDIHLKRKPIEDGDEISVPKKKKKKKHKERSEN